MAPAAPGEIIGPCGPTTSGRMDPFTPALADYGVTVFLGKGARSQAVRDALRGRAVYRVPWEVWWRMRQHFGHKYMTAKELEPFRVQMRRGVILFLGDPG